MKIFCNLLKNQMLMFLKLKLLINPLSVGSLIAINCLDLSIIIANLKLCLSIALCLLVIYYLISSFSVYSCHFTKVNCYWYYCQVLLKMVYYSTANYYPRK